MTDQTNQLSGYRGMWLFTMFDLPVVTKKQRKHAGQFRKFLQRRGFTMLQYSVYARYYASADGTDMEKGRLRVAVPPDGQVRFLTVTDRQFARQEVYQENSKAETETPPQQVMLF